MSFSIINCHLVFDLVDNDTLMSNNAIENMIAEDQNEIIQEDILMLEKVNNNLESQEMDLGNKQDGDIVKEHAAALKSTFSPISHRLRSKK